MRGDVVVEGVDGRGQEPDADKRAPTRPGTAEKHQPIVEMLERFQEIDAAHSAYESAVQHAKEVAGYFELERQQKEARAEERRLCREVAVMQARTVPGLLAKLSAVADIYVHEDLEKDTEYMAGGGKNVSVDDAMSSSYATARA
jgi:hypothetical protein